MKSWYVIQAKPHKEAAVVAQLRLAGYPTFFPILKNCLGSKPLFPSYVFVQLPTQSMSDYRMVSYTRGVIRLLGTPDSGPVAVCEKVIGILMERADSHGTICQELFRRTGEAVRVRVGILRDLVGILEKPVDAAGRLQVLFKMFNRSMKAVLSVRDVMPVAT